MFQQSLHTAIPTWESHGIGQKNFASFQCDRGWLAVMYIKEPAGKHAFSYEANKYQITVQ